MDEDIQPAKFLFHFVEETVQVVQVAHVRLDQQGAAAQFLDLGGGLFGGSAVAEEVDDHVRAVAGEMQGDGAPDAASRAGDEGDPIPERELD